MSMKKGITFIATLLILVCVAFAGTSVWAEPTMNSKTDVRVYNKDVSTEAPYNKISLNTNGDNRTVYYEGTGYSGPLGRSDIWVVTFAGDAPVASLVINPNLRPFNKCDFDPTTGTIKGQFTINNDDLIGIDRIEVSITGMPEVDGVIDSPASFDVDNTAATHINDFLPDPNSNIRNFFVASIDANEDIYAWVRAGYTGVPIAEDSYKGQSAGFNDPVFLMMDAANFRDADADPNAYDLEFVYHDQARNEIGPSPIPRTNITFNPYLDSNDNRNAYTDVSDSGAYQVYIPTDSHTNNSLVFAGTDANKCVVNVDGQHWGVLTNNSTIAAATDPNWEILTIGPNDAAALGIDPNTWTVTDKLTIGVNNDGSAGYDVYFGVNEGVGPRLLVSEVVGGKTQLTFSEPLLGTAGQTVDKSSIKINNSACSYDISFGPGANMMEIHHDLTDGDVVSVSGDNDFIKDKKGNLAKPAGHEVITRTSRQVSRVEVVDVDPATPSTKINVIFSGNMLDNAAIIDANSYQISLGSLDPNTYDTDNDGLVDNGFYSGGITFDTADPNKVEIIIAGPIRDTGDNFPKVTVVGEVKGDTNGKLVDPKTASTKDEVGPYILTASYNRNPGGTQPHSDDVTEHELTINFSEKVDFSSLGPVGPFTISTGAFGTNATYKEKHDAATYHIVMGDGNAITEGASTVYISDASKVKDVNGKEASSTDPVDITDGTIPWIVSVKTLDVGAANAPGNGHINALEVTWNENITENFADPNLVGDNSSVESGYKLDRSNSSSGTSVSNKTMMIDLTEKTSGDTGVRPGFSLYLDGNNYLKDGNGNRIEKPVNISGSNVVDGARPYATKVEFVKPLSGSEYTFRVTYSEDIDPNVWKDPNAWKDFDVYIDSNCETKASVTVGQYKMGSTKKTHVLVLKGTVTGGTSSLYIAPLDQQREAGVYDKVGLFAMDAKGVRDTANYTISSSAQEYTFISQSKPVLNHEPIPSPYFMDLQGDVIGRNGEKVEDNNSGDKWKVYAYSLDNLYRFSHTDPNRHIHGLINNDTKPIDPNDTVTPVLAPKGDLCYGSTYVHDGHYVMHVYGKSDISPGFGDGEPIFLVVEDPNSTHQYLMTNGCSNDLDFCVHDYDKNGNPRIGFYEDHDVNVAHNIDLRQYDSKTLDKGWNLVSISTLKRYIVDDGYTPVVEGRSLENEATGEEVGKKVFMARLDEVVPSLHRQWAEMFTVDTEKDTKNDALRITYPHNPEELTPAGEGIQFFSIGYGYWIYIPDVTGAKLVVLGDVVKDHETKYQLKLDPGVYGGWNLVGYWGGKVYYSSVPDAKTTTWSDAQTDDESVVNIGDAFWSFGSALTNIKAYYNGANSWYSSYPDLGDLNWVGPGYGYWVKINAPCNVRWYSQPQE